MIGDFCKINPPDRKYAKRALFDALGDLKKRFVETSITDRSADKAMTKEAFASYCRYKFGISDAERDSWWSELENDPRVDRDNLGFRGRMQLWIPQSLKRIRDRERGVSDEVTESSAGMKNYQPHGLQVLIDHADGQKTSMADKFITDGLGENRSLLKRGAPETAEKDGTAPAEQPKGRKRKKTFNADDDCPTFYKTVTEATEKLKVKMQGAETAFEKATKELAQIADEEKHRDPAMIGYIYKLQHRAQILTKFKGDDIVTELFNNHENSAGVPTAVPSLHPAETTGNAPGLAPGTPVQALLLFAFNMFVHVGGRLFVCSCCAGAVGMAGRVARAISENCKCM